MILRVKWNTTKLVYQILSLISLQPCMIFFRFSLVSEFLYQLTLGILIGALITISIKAFQQRYQYY